MWTKSMETGFHETGQWTETELTGQCTGLMAVEEIFTWLWKHWYYGSR